MIAAAGTGSTKPPKIRTIGTTGSSRSHFARQVAAQARRALNRRRRLAGGDFDMPQAQASATIRRPGSAPPRNMDSIETSATIE